MKWAIWQMKQRERSRGQVNMYDGYCLHWRHLFVLRWTRLIRGGLNLNRSKLPHNPWYFWRSFRVCCRYFADVSSQITSLINWWIYQWCDAPTQLIVTPSFIYSNYVLSEVFFGGPLSKSSLCVDNECKIRIKTSASCSRASGNRSAGEIWNYVSGGLYFII